MEYFKTGLKSVLGAPLQGSSPPTGAETVERLVDRVQHSTLLDDRRDACRALKSLSKQYRVEVGAQAMDALCQVLEMDRADGEIVSYALDTLCNVMSSEVFEEEEHPDVYQSSKTSLGEQFTEIFMKQTDNIGLVLGFLEEYDFQVRWPALKLLTSLIHNRPRDLQDIILVSPMGVSKLMDLLGDSREVIRNDALILLTHLTKGNANIQKIVAFENAFDRLFDVMADEGYADGGIVVEDCLAIVHNLLKHNTSNQNFFKEGSYIQRLSPMFSLPNDNEDISWSSQKVNNILSSLQVIRMLVMPGNPAQVTSSCQRTIRSSGILEALCGILMASGVPVDVLTETINAVAEIIRGNLANQEYFLTVMAPSKPPRPAIVVLLLSMVNEKQPLELRCSVLYSFQCYLYKNEVGQAQLVQTLLPSSAEVGTGTTGELLVAGLLSGHMLSTWLSAVALSHALVENPAQKEQLLRVALATGPGAQPVTLLQQCSSILQQSTNVQSKVGILMLLAMWLSHCPLAVRDLLNTPSCIPYLTAQVGANEHQEHEELLQGLCAFLMGICVIFNDDSVPSYTRDSLCQLVSKRVGQDVFLDKLGEVSKHELYSKAHKHPQLQATSPEFVLLDHEFCKLFKALEGMVVKAVSPKDAGLHNGGTELTLTATESSLLLQYKELIRSQDNQIQEMRRQLHQYEIERQGSQMQIEELSATVSQLRDQTRLLSAAANTGVTSTLSSDINKLSISNQDNLSKCSELEDELDKLRKDQEDLLVLLADQDTKLMKYKTRLKQLGEKVESDDDDDQRNAEEP
ncbi:General vesicular transport factor p115 [Frankliniella fusca]|uniref:General vesicular transport factor p115 n=1 Tax=Frankliniella fusca TaxID=407009 RepID=A0AAE1HK56_9NEOP|nr:General vesicular transport factor p115 [Frankliniella fusca]